MPNRSPGCRGWILAGIALLSFLNGRRAASQVSLADDIIVASKGEEDERTRGRKGELRRPPGSNAGPFWHSPGTSEILLGAGRLPESVPIPSSIARPRQASSLTNPSRGQQEPGRGLFQFGRGPDPLRRQPPAPQSAGTATIGFLETADPDEGPPHGVNLDLAIEMLVRDNRDLRTKAFELPMAEADVLTAGLRSNPLFFYDTSNVPYGNYSERRPGDIEYGVSLVLPFDYSGKRDARREVSRAAKSVLEARYQDAVRAEIDELYRVFVDVLEARESVRGAEQRIRLLDRLLEQAGLRAGREGEELENLDIERETAVLLLEGEQSRLLGAKRRLASMLALDLAAADQLEVRGSLLDRGPPPPGLDELVSLAFCHRPDLAAHRLGIKRALADTRLARADRLSDAYFLYSPYGFIENSRVGNLNNVATWGAGLFVSVPLFDRNQGNIKRATLNVAQAQGELAAMEQRVFAEVQQAHRDYEDSSRALVRMRERILPTVRRRREAAWVRLREGRKEPSAFLSAYRDESSIVRHYFNTLVRHRRAMLALNTALGMRLMP